MRVAGGNITVGKEFGFCIVTGGMSKKEPGKGHTSHKYCGSSGFWWGRTSFSASSRCGFEACFSQQEGRREDTCHCHEDTENLCVGHICLFCFGD